MLRSILTVGGLTLLSRATGFLRDIMLAAILGAGPIADAFFVALRLPNHFRAIFAEGAFNSAFVPAYARIRQQEGGGPARVFADRIFTLLFAAEAVLLALALTFTPAVIKVLAPGFAEDQSQFALAVSLTRITFPYLVLISLVTLYGGMLNAVQRFASPAAAPILLNLSMMATLALAAFFPTAGHAAAWGVFIAGILEVLLVGADQARRDGLPRFRAFELDEDTRRFFRALGPATLGSAGLQIALFADTIIATFLPTGALSALYYADRLNQLPIGVIGIAAGTVVLPEMTRRIARSDERGARHAQNRVVELTLLMSIPFLVAFLLVPDRIMLGLFSRGAFTAADAAAAGATLAAYAIGLLPFVLIRSYTAIFLARGDTATPVKALMISVVINVALKVLLMRGYAQVGLAIATAVGAWVNFAFVVFFAARAGFVGIDARLRSASFKFVIAAMALALALLASEQWIDLVFGKMRHFRAETILLTLTLIGGIVYGAAIAALFGRDWLRDFRRGVLSAPSASATPAAPPQPSGVE